MEITELLFIDYPQCIKLSALHAVSHLILIRALLSWSRKLRFGEVNLLKIIQQVNLCCQDLQQVDFFHAFLPYKGDNS